MIYGYTRISTPSQNINRQIRNILSLYPKAIIITEIYSGRKQDRPEWQKLFKRVTQADKIVFDSVSRMSRNADEGIEQYMELYDRNVTLEFLKEPHINTDTYKSALENKIALTGDDVDDILKGVNSYLKKLAKKQIRLAFEQAQKEVDDLRQRTREGIETARLNGKQIGQKEGNTLKVKKEKPIKKIIQEKSKDFSGSNTDAEVMAIICSTEYYDEKKKQKRKYNISRNTYYKYKKELMEDDGN